MFFTIKLIISLILLIAAVAAIYIGYKRMKIPMRMIFGKKQVKKKGNLALLAVYLYATGAFLGILAFIVMF